MNTNQSPSRPDGSPVAVAASDGAPVPGLADQHMTIKVSGAASHGAYSLVVYSHAPGAPGPPAHLHRDHEEAFYVIEGELTLTVGEFGESSVTVRAGQAAVVPRGVIHRPGNLSGRPVRLILINSPAMDDFFTELGQVVERNGGRLNAEDLWRLGDRHDTIFTGSSESSG
jgi:mannose-6-phosphate isomerase-like protein (cupin superfamily)